MCYTVFNRKITDIFPRARIRRRERAKDMLTHSKGSDEMNKSVYSLVLMDDVVAEIDRAAYAQNTSRSNLINQILADYVSYVTPEKRMREVFRRVERILTDGDTFQVLLQPSESMFSLRSALSYKYNPNVRYSVELYQNAAPALGELRVSLRSQNSTLMLYLLQYYKLFSRIETAHIGPVESDMEGGRFVRKLVLRRGDNPANEEIGQAIADYIGLFDTGLKTFFNELNNPSAAVAAVDRLYGDYVRTHDIIL